MKRRILFFIIITFSLLLITGCNKKENSSNTGGTTHGDELTPTEKYYLPIVNVSKDDSNAFKNELHKLVEQSHTKRLTYKEVWTALETADQDPNNKNNILCFYSGQSLLKSKHVGSEGKTGEWNREHLYPQSNGFKQKWNGDYLPAHNDIFHVRATEYTTNSSRGDDPFGEGGLFYTPRPEIRGDIARALFYMTVRYEADDYASYTYNGKAYDDLDDLDLELASGDTKPFSGQYYVNDLACLIKWFYEDPVSEEEKERNEKVFNIQGNRNPFIDHPEYLKILYPELTANY